MRIWSLHPKYLDAKGLVALWRESLLAKHVLEGKTKGYKNHPQLEIFKNSAKPLECINQYLAAVYETAMERGYDFDQKKIKWDFKPSVIKVTTGQLAYEKEHLLRKLKTRDKKKFKELESIHKLQTHPLFKTIKGNIAQWEVAE